MVQTLWYTCNDFFCIWGRWPSQLTLLDWLRAKLSLQASQLKSRVWNRQLCFWNVQVFQWCNFLAMLFSVVELIGLCFLLSSRYWQSLSEISSRHDELWNCNNGIARVFSFPEMRQTPGVRTTCERIKYHSNNIFKYLVYHSIRYMSR